MEIESTASDVDGESSAKWRRVVAYVLWYRSRPSWLLVAADDRNKGGKEGRGRALDKMESLGALRGPVSRTWLPTRRYYRWMCVCVFFFTC